MGIWRVAVGAVVGVIAISSCAKRVPDDVNLFEQKSLDAWMAENVNHDGTRAVKQSNGMWVEFLEDGDQTMEAGRDTTVWVSLKYTSTDIAGNVFYTRDSMEALRQRSFTPHTYYSPEYVYCNAQNTYGLMPGQHFALINDLTKPDGGKIKLARGSHVRLYIPSFQAYGSNTSSDDQGYGGQYALGQTKIVIQDLEVREVTKNPLLTEEALVERLAVDKWGKAVDDTLATGFFVDTINFRPRADLLELYPNHPFEKVDGLTKDSTARIRYIGRFLPTKEYPHGFIFDTNIPEVYEEFFNRRKNQNYPADERTIEVLSYRPADDDGTEKSMISAFYRAIPELRRGLWTRIVFPSAYGYGAIGRSKALDEEQAYYAQLMQYYAYSSMYSGYGYGGGYGYGSGYGYGGYGGMYDYDPYSMYGYNYMNMGQTEEDDSIVTEIAPYSPLIFEIYIEPLETDE
jgi:hypothetical protein